MSYKKQITPELKVVAGELLDYVKKTPILKSLLRDLNWFPEQLEEGSPIWCNMLILIQSWKDMVEKPINQNAPY